MADVVIVDDGKMDVGLKATVAAFEGERVAKAYVEQTSIRLALDSQPSAPIVRHSEIAIDKGGVTHISEKVGDGPMTKSNGYATPNYEQDMETVLDGFVTHAKGNDQFKVGMNPGRRETVTFQDEGQPETFKSDGSCASGVCNFSITDGGKPIATIVGDQTYVGDGLTKTHLSLLSPDQKTKLGTVDIDSRHSDTKTGSQLVMDVTIHGKEN